MFDTTSPVDAVGASVIDRVPLWLERWAITWFGTHDKTVLRVSIVLVISLLACALGLASRRSARPVTTGIVVAGALGAACVLERPVPASAAVTAIVIGAVVAMTGAHVLWRSITAPPQVPGESRAPSGWDRRSFMRTAAAATTLTIVAASASAALRRRHVHRTVADLPSTLPEVFDLAAPTPDPIVAGIDYITPTAAFYRIDTALSFPTVDLDSWSITVSGLVRTDVRLSYRDLCELDQVERTITMCCVSNEVGGPYIGNAVWQGVLLSDVLNLAGVRPEAEQVYSTSLDGWTSGFPVEVALDGRDALIALGMNGEVLPVRHGFPARLIVPGLYGYVSATKWLASIELNRWSEARGYWIPRGWSRLGPVKTQSRIDVPRRFETLDPGPTRIAGVAWAQTTGIDKVEVRVDSESWREAQLSSDVTDDAWRMWTLDWNATPGSHTIQVRATDKRGRTQTDVVAPVAPDGATGWHTRRVEVRSHSS